MCGFLAVFGENLESYPGPLLESSAAAIHHRGPDSRGTVVDDSFRGVALRLSIIDLANGDQPLSDPTGRYVILFNGEIFNYRALSERLSQRGVRFRTRSDTEVLLQMVIEFGEASLGELEGQFSFLVHDRKERTLFGARDVWGICPFHYSVRPGGEIAFGSEVKAFRGLPGFAFDLDPAGVEQLAWCWSNLPPTTCWRGVSELPPGHWFRVRPGEAIEPRRYANIWEPAPDVRPATLPDAIDAARSQLEAEVRAHMIADVPVGAYLSGGLDSSVLAALAARVSPEGLRTFSVTFEDAEFDESAAQREMLEHLNVQHTAINVGAADIVRHFPAAVYHAEKPLFRTAPVPLFLLSKTVREHGLKVVLTGEGSDELFWGYDTYRELIIRRLWARNPKSQWRPSLLSRIFPYFPQYQDPKMFAFLKLFYKKTLEPRDHPLYPMLPRLENGWGITQYMREDRRMSREALEGLLAGALALPAGEKSDLKRCQQIELATLLPGYLLSSQGDRMLSAHSVEGRFPFLGRGLARLLWQLPDGWKLKGLKDKYLLREAFRGVIPEAIRSRPKFAYRAPDVGAFFPGTPEYVRHLLSREVTERVGMFSVPEVERLLTKLSAHGKGQAVTMKDNMSFIWILSTHLLHHAYVQGHGYENIIS